MSIPVAARFRAIVTAPLDGSSGSSDRQQTEYEHYGGVRFQDPSGTKKKKYQDDVGISAPKKIGRRISEDEGGSTREPTISYKDRDALLNALKDRFEQGPHVDFHGTYEIFDSGLDHKARITSMALEIWKATGYRFTVKDHPQFTNGHKTRFWCSQDEAHRSKSSRAARKAQGELYRPRQSSSGETLAKNRFPCRSRLLISSRDSCTTAHPIVTVRMHHHVSHEPYVDSNLPPEVAQDIYWIAKMGGRHTIDRSDGMMNLPRLIHPLQHSNERALSEPSSVHELETYTNIHTEPEVYPDDHSQSTVFTQDHEPPPPSSHSTPPHLPSQPLQNADTYHRRMRAYIQILRDFCDGLEYQLPFNDPRMLEQLEREGGPFIAFAADCLKREGRLGSTDQDILPHASGHLAQAHFSNGVSAHPDQRVLYADATTI